MGVGNMEEGITAGGNQHTTATTSHSHTLYISRPRTKLTPQATQPTATNSERESAKFKPSLPSNLWSHTAKYGCDWPEKKI